MALAGIVVGAALLAASLTLAVGASAASATSAAPPSDALVAAPAATPAAVPDPEVDDAGSTPPPSPPPPAAPTIASPAAGTLITTNHVLVTGTHAPGDEVQVFSPAGGDTPACIVHADDPAGWSCDVLLDNGPNQSIRVVATEDSSRAASVSVSVLAPPTIVTAAVTGGSVNGVDGYPNALVTVTTGAGYSCSVIADANGAWGCVPIGGTVSEPIPTGDYTVTATQTAPYATSAASAAVHIHVDADPPPAPTITSPHTGTALTPKTRFTVSGTGVDGAVVHVDTATETGSSRLCEVPVANERWSCSVPGLPAGSYTISAMQLDAVGNPGPAVAVAISVAAATPPPAHDPGAEEPGTHAPGAAAPGAATPHKPSTPGSTSSPTPSPTPTPAAVPPFGFGSGGGPGGPYGDWLTTTPFTTTTPPAIGPDAFPGWLRALLLAAVALLLLALPARLLAGSLAAARRAPRGAASRVRLFGRNRPIAATQTTDAPSATSRWLVGGAVLVAATALVTLSSPVNDQPAYLRLFAAVAVAVLLVNAVWAASGLLASRHAGCGAASVVLAPRTLVIVAAAAGLSRLTGLDPALLFGLVLGVSVASSATVAARGRLAVAQVASLAAIGMLAWMLTAVLPVVSGPVSAFTTEVINAVAIVSIGSAAVSLVPVGRLAGRAIFAWSRPVWVGLSLVTGTILFALLVPVDALWRAGGGGLLLVAAGMGFAGISLAIWLWTRYIEPVR